MAHALHLLSNPYTHDARVRNETRALARHGHAVTVIAWDRLGQGPAEEVVEGVRVVRVPNTPAMRRRPFDILRLPGWWHAARTAGLGENARIRVDLIHAHDLDTLPAGVRLKHRIGAPLVFDAHEIWGHMIARDLPFPIPQWFHRLERKLLPHVDEVITVNEPLAQHYRALGARNVTLVMNAKPIQTPTYRAPPPGAFIVRYIGTLNESRFLLGTIDALQGMPGVRLVIGGLGKPRYVQRLEARIARSDNASFLGPVPAQRVLPLTIDSHLVLCMTDPRDRNNRIATANKQFEAMACGRPVLTSEGTYPGRFTMGHGVGLAVPHTIAGVRTGVQRLVDEPGFARVLGERALWTANNGYDWATQEARLGAVYAEALHQP